MTKISALPEATTANDSDLLEIVQGGANKRMTVGQVNALVIPDVEAYVEAYVEAWGFAVGITDDPDAKAWRDQVVINGGTVGGPRLKIVTDFIKAEKAAGTWALTDDYWGLWAENAVQSLTSLKQRRLCTAVAAPAFTADRGYQSNGTTSYINSNFIPNTHTTTMSLTSARMAVYERTDYSSTTQYAMGVLSGADNRFLFNPRRTTTLLSYAILGSTLNGTIDGLVYGLASASRSSTTFAFYKNGVAGTPAALVGAASTLPTHALYIGAYNNSGTATGFRPTSLGFACIGAVLTPAQELAQWTNVQAWATAIGANV